MGKPNYVKLRTNLRLAINRLKLLEKKKTEQALKARREIADYIGMGKDDRARIRVEHIIREDYLVEAMEIVEMFCDLLLARFGLLERMNEMDPGLEEAVATILWVSPRLSTDIQEMKEITKQLISKFGKEFNDMCVKNGLENVNEKVLVKMSLNAPPKLLIENYMIEIAKSYNVAFTPDQAVLMGTDENTANDLIELGIPSDPSLGMEDLLNTDKKDPKGPPGGGATGGYGGGSGGGGGMSAPPPFQPGSSAYYPGESAPPYTDSVNAGASTANSAYGLMPPSTSSRLPPPLPSNPPNSAGNSPGKGENSDLYSVAITPEQRMQQQNEQPPPYSQGISNATYGVDPNQAVYADIRPGQGKTGDDIYVPVMPDPPLLPNENIQSGKHNTDYLTTQYPSQPGQQHNTTPGGVPVLPDIPSASLNDLPDVPSDSVATNAGDNDVDFDDLTKRFEALKKKK